MDPEDQVREVAGSLSHDLHWAITDAKTAESFGEITSVPAMFLFDRSGKVASVIYGAPPDLHQQVERTLSELTAKGAKDAKVTKSY